MKKRKNIDDWLIPILFFGGIVLIAMSANTTLNLPSKDYIFSTTFSSNLSNISGFSMNIDFGSVPARGELLFRIQNSSVDTISILPPRNITITEIRLCISDDNCLNEGKDYQITRQDEDNFELVLKNFTRRLIAVKSTFKFEGDIIPNGRFIIMPHVDDVYYYAERTITLHLGNYSCTSICFSRLEGFNYPEYLVTKNEEIVRFSTNKNFTKTLPHSFIINTFNKNTKFWKESELALGVALMVAALTLFVGNIKKTEE